MVDNEGGLRNRRAKHRDGVDRHGCCGFDVDAHRVAFLAFRLRNGQGDLIECGKQRRHLGLKRLAAGGQPDVAPGALEQLRIQLALKTADGLRQRRLSHAKALRRVRHMLGLRHLVKIAQLQQLHAHLLQPQCDDNAQIMENA